MTSDPSDLTVLTPGHFLTGRALIAPHAPDVSRTPTNRLNAWQLIDKLSQLYWQRWSEEYLTTIQTRFKWASPCRQMRVGDMVLVRNENTPPQHWMMARVIEIFPGRDGRVRSCRIQTQGSVYDRPISQLVYLPVQEDVSNEAEMPADDEEQNGAME